jgi:hypothetical protein
VVVLVLLNLSADRRGRVLGLADGARVLVLRLEALEQVALLGLHLGPDLLGHLGGDDRLVLLTLMDHFRHAASMKRSSFIVTASSSARGDIKTVTRLQAGREIVGQSGRQKAAHWLSTNAVGTG